MVRSSDINWGERGFPGADALADPQHSFGLLDRVRLVAGYIPAATQTAALRKPYPARCHSFAHRSRNVNHPKLKNMISITQWPLDSPRIP